MTGNTKILNLNIQGLLFRFTYLLMFSSNLNFVIKIVSEGNIEFCQIGILENIDNAFCTKSPYQKSKRLEIKKKANWIHFRICYSDIHRWILNKSIPIFVSSFYWRIFYLTSSHKRRREKITFISSNMIPSRNILLQTVDIRNWNFFRYWILHSIIIPTIRMNVIIRIIKGYTFVLCP